VVNGCMNGNEGGAQPNSYDKEGKGPDGGPVNDIDDTLSLEERRALMEEFVDNYMLEVSNSNNQQEIFDELSTALGITDISLSNIKAAMMAILTSKQFLSSVNITRYSIASTYPASSGATFIARNIGITNLGKVANVTTTKILPVLATITSSLSIMGDAAVFAASEKKGSDWANFIVNEGINITTIINPVGGTSLYLMKNMYFSQETFDLLCSQENMHSTLFLNSVLSASDGMRMFF